jgi:replicative DNA helicase
MSKILVHTPAEVSAQGIAYLNARRDGKTYGIPLGLDSMDKPQKTNNTEQEFFVPVWPGEMVTVIGRPGNGKTGLMMWWARSWAKKLQERGEHNRLVLYVTYEQTIEELTAFQLAAETGVSITDMAMGQVGSDDWQKVEAAAARRLTLPLWFMGHSDQRRSGQKRPRMTTESIAEALQDIQDWTGEKREIDMVFVDYLQRMPFAGRPENKVIGHTEQLDELKNIGMEFGTRMVVGIQAKREVDSRQEPIPTYDDGQWTSNIEQSSDGILTVCRPRRYRNEGEPFGSQIVRGYQQMIITVAKRKLGPDNFARWVSFDPRYNELDDMEIKHHDFANDV